MRVSYSDANLKASENRDRLYRDRYIENRAFSLFDERKKVVPTFREAGNAYYEVNRQQWKGDNHEKTWKLIVNKYAIPALGDMPVDLIKRQHVQDVIEPIWYDKTGTARKLHGFVKAVLSYCVGRDYVAVNVAENTIKGVLPSLPPVKAHHRSMHYSEVPGAVRTIEEKATGFPSKLCLLFVIATGCRSGEAREAKWDDEIDLESKTWTIPAARMKASKEYRIPLSTMALDILERAKALPDYSGLVIPSPMKPLQPMHSAALQKLLRVTGLHELTNIHGFRTSFRTWAGECTDVPREVCEMALSHAVGNAVEQSYFSGDLLEKRIELMQRWADYLSEVSTGG